MVEESNVKKNYNLSNAELYLFTYTLVSCMRRDLEYLEDYGVTEIKITALNAQNEQFNSIPNDDILKSDYSYAINVRNQNREVVEKTTKSIGLRAKEVYFNNQAREKVLNYINLSHLKDLELLNTAISVHTNAVTFLNDLKPEGITQAYLDTFKANIEEFKLAIQTAKEKLQLRNEGTQTRIEAGNKLYSLISKYCDYGKAVFENINPSRYNDYVIYAPSAGSLTAPTNLLASYSGTTYMWDMVEHATSYQLEYSPDGETWTEVYTGSDTYCPFVPLNEGWSYYRVRARNNNGFGPFSDVLKNGYYAILPPPSHVTAEKVPNTANTVAIKWSEVITATEYKVYTSSVAIGMPADKYNLFATTDQINAEYELEVGKRHYFQLTATNSHQKSAVSSAVFIDLV